MAKRYKCTKKQWARDKSRRVKPYYQSTPYAKQIYVARYRAYTRNEIYKIMTIEGYDEDPQFKSYNYFKWDFYWRWY